MTMRLAFYIKKVNTSSDDSPKTSMKKIICLLSLFVFVGALPVEAKKNNNKQAAAARAAKAKQEKAEKDKHDKINKEIEDFLETHDKNKDKSVTLEEFVAGESDAKAAEAKFMEHNKNKDRYLSRTEIQEMLGL